MKQTLLFALLLIGLCISSCGDSNNCGSTTFNLSTEIQEELDAFISASMVFGNDPSMENCNAYRAAAQDYVDVIASFRDCAEDAGQGAEFSQSLAEAQDSIDDIEC